MNEQEFRQRVEQEGYGEIGEQSLEADRVTDEHTHDFSAAAFVLSGQLSGATSEGTTTCRAGDSFFLEADVPHSEIVGSDGVRFLFARK